MNSPRPNISQRIFPTASAFALLLWTACGSSIELPDESSQDPVSKAASILNYPTKWTLANDTAASLTFSCVCPKPLGLTNPINMATTTVAAKSTQVLTWGRGWYNDGLGLNFCNWNCTAKRGAGVAATLTFKTDWGENITLRAKSTGGLAVQR